MSHVLETERADTLDTIPDEARPWRPDTIEAKR
jgi:hypothetical protein